MEDNAEVTKTIPLKEEKGEIILTPDGKELELLFEENHFKKEAKDIKDLKIQTKDGVGQGYDYVLSLLGEGSSELSEKFVIEFVDGEDFRHQGILMRVGIQLLRQAQKKPENSYMRDLVQSRFVHEILHNLTDDEDFPMFAEIIYMHEKGHKKRLDQMNELSKKGKLPSRYQEGLQKIGRWLGKESTPELFEYLSKEDNTKLKEVFTKNVGQYIDREFKEQKAS